MKNLLVILIVFGLLFTNTVAFTENGDDTAAEETTEQVAEQADENQPVQFNEAEYLGNMKKVAENNDLIMYFNEETTEVAVKVKKTGTVWYTNPPKRGSDPIASGVNKLKLGSQLTLTYYTAAAQQKIMDNYNDSIARGQFVTEPIENGIKVTYTIGKVEDILVIPELISAERFEQLLEKIPDEKDRRNVERRYGLLSLSKARNEQERKELLEQYPVLEDHDIYRLRTSANRFVLEEIEQILADAGYTLEQMNADHAENNVPPKEPNKELFTVSMEYTLDGENLIVNIPTDEIQFDPTFPLTQIKVLEFFGSADHTEEGYIFVPDGSGALIYLNNGETQARPFISQVYGRDRGIKITELLENTEQVYLPVYGLVKGDEAFFAIIEDGDAFATIYGDVGGKIHSYNTVCTEFTTLPNDTLDLGQVAGNNTIKIYQQRVYQGNFRIRFAFLDGEDANYMGMANYYKDYLVARGVLEKIEPKENIPFFLELVGAIDTKKPFLGIPINTIEPLTTYDQAAEIASLLMENDIKNIQMKYSGWFNGGLKQSYAAQVKLIRHLGGKDAFNRLVKFTKDNNIGFYPDVSFEYVYDDKAFDGFSPRRDASRFINKEVALIYKINIATFLTETLREATYMVAPTKVGSTIDNFIKKSSQFGLTGLSLRTLGSHLNSNFRENRLVDRQQSLEYNKAALEKLVDSGYDLMLNGGNSYALPYAKRIINMPFDSNNFTIADESIPFYQLVVRGYVEYAGEPINLSTDYKRTMLKTIETGAGVYFKWIYGENSLIKDTDYEELYSVCYEDWFEDAVNFYKEANSILADVQGQRIVKHQRLDKGVYQVTYENGKSIIVNYNKKPVKVKGVTVGAESYHVLQEVKGE